MIPGALAPVQSPWIIKNNSWYIPRFWNVFSFWHQTKPQIWLSFFFVCEIKAKREINSRLRCNVRARTGISNRLRASLKHERPMSLPLSCWQISVTEKDCLSWCDQKSYLNPSQQMFNWHSSILKNCNNNKISYLPLGKERPSPSPNSRLTEWVGALVGWLVPSSLAFSSQRYTERICGCYQFSRPGCTFTPYWLWCVSDWGTAHVCCPPQQGNHSLLSAASLWCPFGQEGDPSYTWENIHGHKPWWLSTRIDL